MKEFIGTKIINAKPMSLLEYNAFRGWNIPNNEDGATTGFLVEYINEGNANTEKYKNYVSWSPSEVFENTYKSSGELSFGDALVYLKRGHKVARNGWNGKGIFIELQNPTENSKMTSPYIFIDTTSLQTDNDLATRSLVPWIASQTDILSNDWRIV
jgi:hypothetical protein